MQRMLDNGDYVNPSVEIASAVVPAWKQLARATTLLPSRVWNSESPPSPTSPRASRPQERMRQLLEEAELADQLGLDVFAIGEHHRPDYLISAPAVALAAVAARTERIRLSSAVTVLSSDDPVRVFQAVRRGRPDLGRARRDHGGPRLLHRVVPAVRLRPRRLRRALRREARAAAEDPRQPGRDLVRPPSRAARRGRRLAAARAGPAARLGRRRRHAGVGHARRDARAAADGRDHRRHARPLRPAREPLPRVGARGRA